MILIWLTDKRKHLIQVQPLSCVKVQTVLCGHRQTSHNPASTFCTDGSELHCHLWWTVSSFRVCRRRGHLMFSGWWSLLPRSCSFHSAATFAPLIFSTHTSASFCPSCCYWLCRSLAADSTCCVCSALFLLPALLDISWVPLTRFTKILQGSCKWLHIGLPKGFC